MRVVIHGHPKIALNGDSMSTTWNSIGIESGPISTVKVIAPRLGRLVLSKAEIEIVLCDSSDSLTPQRRRVLTDGHNAYRRPDIYQYIINGNAAD